MEHVRHFNDTCIHTRTHPFVLWSKHVRRATHKRSPPFRLSVVSVLIRHFDLPSQTARSGPARLRNTQWRRGAHNDRRWPPSALVQQTTHRPPPHAHTHTHMAANKFWRNCCPPKTVTVSAEAACVRTHARTHASTHANERTTMRAHARTLSHVVRVRACVRACVNMLGTMHAIALLL